MKGNSKKFTIIFISLAIFAFICTTGFVLAQETQPTRGLTYIPLEPLPGDETGASASDLPTYLTTLFRIILGVAALIAVIQITYGGFEYMGSSLITSKEEGKERIKEALIGLFLAMGAWLILYTVNPATLEFKFTPKPVPQQVRTPQNEPVTARFVKERFCFADSSVSVDDIQPIGTYGQYFYTVGVSSSKDTARLACHQASPTNRNRGPATNNCPGAAEEAVYCTDLGRVQN